MVGMVGKGGTFLGSVITGSALALLERARVGTQPRLVGVEGGGVSTGSGVVYGGGVIT